MLSELLPEEKRRLNELEQQYFQLEKSANKSGTQQQLYSDIFLKLNEMDFRLDELEKLVVRETKAKRDDYRRLISI